MLPLGVWNLLPFQREGLRLGRVPVGQGQENIHHRLRECRLVDNIFLGVKGASDSRFRLVVDINNT